MPKPVMSLDEFRDRFLLEIWLFVEGDLAEQFDPHDVAQQVFDKHPRAKESWYPSAIAALVRDKLISHASDDNTAEQVSDKAFYLTEMGLRWADSNHNRYDGYQDWQLEELASSSPAAASSETKRSRGPLVLGRTPIRDRTLGSVSQSMEAASELAFDPQIVPTEAEIIRHLDRNPAGAEQFARDLKNIQEAVRGHNNWTNDDERQTAQRMAKQLEAGALMVTASTVDMGVLRRIVEPALRWALSKTGEGFFSQVGSKIHDALTWMIGGS